MVTRKPEDLENVSEEVLSKKEKDWLERMVKRIEMCIHDSYDTEGPRNDRSYIFVKLNSFFSPVHGTPFCLAVLAKKYKDLGWKVETGYQTGMFGSTMPVIKLS